MFVLYVVIDHYKLLKRNKIINKELLEEKIKNIMTNYGGVINPLSNYLFNFSANYDYSKRKFITALQEVVKELRLLELVGFSLIVDLKKIENEYEYLESLRKIKLQTNDINKLWFTTDAYIKVSNYVNGEILHDIVKIYDNFDEINLPEVKGNIPINSFIQQSLNFSSSLIFFNNKIDTIIYDNVKYWCEQNNIFHLLYVDFGSSYNKIFMLLSYIISLKNKFDPNVSLDESEKHLWGIYIDLYNKFTEKDYHCFILDDPLLHFKKLIFLWFEFYCKKNSVVFYVNINYASDLDEIWSLLSIINGLKIVVTAENIEGNSYTTIPLEEVKIINFSGLLTNKSEDSIKILYLLLATEGNLLLADFFNIISQYNKNVIVLREEIENYKRNGLLIGDLYLYPGNYKLKGFIEDNYSGSINSWISEFFDNFIVSNYSNTISYSYILSLLGLNTKDKINALMLLYNYIKKSLDIGLYVKLSPDFYTLSNNDSSLMNILEYKKVREARLRFNIIDINKPIDNTGLYSDSLETLDILNKWSINADQDLIVQIKKLYFDFQTSGDKYNENRVKTLFALELLDIGRISESVDYFDLNYNYSKNLSDTYSYIRNGCFLSMALFVKGDISGVLRITEQLLDYKWLYFKTRWLIYLEFIRVRALCELGYYKEGLQLLEKSIITAKSFNYMQIESSLLNWKGRILFYLGKEGEARATLLGNVPSNEVYFFLSEIEYYSGNLNKANEFIEKTHLDSDSHTLFDEILYWRDGYFIVEEFYNRKNRNSVLFEEIRNFKLLVQGSLGSLDAIRELLEITNLIPNTTIKSNDYKYLFYLYLCSENLPDNSIVNRDNVFNKVLRLLQQRASNMSLHNQKHLFFENYINSKIIEISDTRKLY
ncbi:MAG: hypothetical protein JXR64_13635 [Spirochaetales bacterium]|nr:hypothetical protein [Spirochaetales bacterium]